MTFCQRKVELHKVEGASKSDHPADIMDVDVYID